MLSSNLATLYKHMTRELLGIPLALCEQAGIFNSDVCGFYKASWAKIGSIRNENMEFGQ